MDVIKSPHDSVFQLAFQDPEVVRDELKAVLPPEVFALVDFSTLTPLRNRSVDTDLSTVTSDVMYSVQIAGTEAYVWFLIEHQSHADRFIAFRLLRYMVGAWGDLLKDDERNPQAGLPLIIPIVVLHDPAGRTAPLRFSDLYDAPPQLVDLVRSITPDFTYIVDDLMAVDHDTIYERSQSAVYHLVLWLLRTRGHGEDERFQAYKQAWEALTPDNKKPFAEAFLVYIMNTCGGEEAMPLRAAAEASPSLEDQMVTIRDKLFEAGEKRGLEQGIQQGLEQGIQQGKSRGQAEFLLEQVVDKFGGAPDDVVARIQGASEADLKLWGHRILRADSLQQLFEDA